MKHAGLADPVGGGASIRQVRERQIYSLSADGA